MERQTDGNARNSSTEGWILLLSGLFRKIKRNEEREVDYVDDGIEAPKENVVLWEVAKTAVWKSLQVKGFTLLFCSLL